MRINKFLALCGVASRRESDKIVEEGRVRINGRSAKQGADVNEKKDKVTVDGKEVFPAEKYIYLMLHKPKGYVCTVSDECGRRTVMDLIKGFEGQRLFPVGRLDYDSEGLLLITNDGDLANKLTHPSHEISKTYVAKVEGDVKQSEIDKLKSGVIVDGVRTLPCDVSMLEFNETSNISRVEIVIREGRNRQIRKMFEQGIKREVIFLKRTKIGQIKLGGLSRGQFRELNAKELRYLMDLD